MTKDRSPNTHAHYECDWKNICTKKIRQQSDSQMISVFVWKMTLIY